MNENGKDENWLNLKNKLFAHKWWPPFEKYEVVSSRAIVTPMDNDVAKSQTMWFFLGVSAKAKEAGKRQSIRKHLMLEFVDGSDEYMLYVSEVEISKEDIIILKKFNKERIENAPDTVSFDINKFTSMTTKSDAIINDTNIEMFCNAQLKMIEDMSKKKVEQYECSLYQNPKTAPWSVFTSYKNVFLKDFLSK